MSSGLSWFCERLERNAGKTSAVWGGLELSYADLWQQIATWRQRFAAAGLRAGDVCAIVGDQSSDVCARPVGGAIARDDPRPALFALARTLSVLF